MKLEPPSLEILAIKSVFNVGLPTFSWNTTILLVLGAEPAVNAFETIVVDVADAGAEAVNNTYPSFPEPVGLAPPSLVQATYPGWVTPPPSPSSPVSLIVPAVVAPEVICG